MAAARFPRLLRRLTAGVPSHGFAIAHASERTSTLATKLAEQSHAFAKTVAAIRRDATLSPLGRSTKIAMAAEQTRERIEKMRSEFWHREREDEHGRRLDMLRRETARTVEQSLTPLELAAATSAMQQIAAMNPKTAAGELTALLHGADRATVFAVLRAPSLLPHVTEEVRAAALVALDPEADVAIRQHAAAVRELDEAFVVLAGDLEGVARGDVDLDATADPSTDDLVRARAIAARRAELGVPDEPAPPARDPLDDVPDAGPDIAAEAADRMRSARAAEREAATA